MDLESETEVWQKQRVPGRVQVHKHYPNTSSKAGFGFPGDWDDGGNLETCCHISSEVLKRSMNTEDSQCAQFFRHDGENMFSLGAHLKAESYLVKIPEDLSCAQINPADAFLPVTQVPVSALVSFVDSLEMGYSKHQNPYHNLTHAADVTQTIHYLLLRTGLLVLHSHTHSLRAGMTGWRPLQAASGTTFWWRRSLRGFLGHPTSSSSLP